MGWTMLSDRLENSRPPLSRFSRVQVHSAFLQSVNTPLTRHATLFSDAFREESLETYHCAPFHRVLWRTLNVPYWETIVNGRERLRDEFCSLLEEVYK